MTIFLVLGIFAGLYMIWLLFTLATYALPVGAGIALSFWMRDQDYGYLAAIFGGFAGGVAIHVIGQILFASIRSPIIRVCSEWDPIARSAERIISGFGLPT